MGKTVLNPPAKKQKPSYRPGDGTLIDVLIQSVIQTDGVTHFKVQVDLTKAPVPNRRYAPDVGHVVLRQNMVHIGFGELKLASEGEIRSFLTIKMPLIKAGEFVEIMKKQWVKKEDQPSLDSLVASHDYILEKIPNEPDEHISLVANMILCSADRDEGCLDFYHVSASASAALINNQGQQMGVDPIVRIDLSLPFLHQFLDKVSEVVEQNYNATESNNEII